MKKGSSPFIKILLIMIFCFITAIYYAYSEDPWKIAADRLDFKDGMYKGEGNIVIYKQDRKITADLIEFNKKNMIAEVVGNVKMTLGDDFIACDKLNIDLNTETGEIYDGTLFFNENHFYLKGDKIKKLGKDTYYIDRASITTCDISPPAWQITGQDINVRLEGYGTIKHAALWTANIPVLYSPLLVFPAKIKRQSGLLAPRIGYSNRKGEEIIQPFYWAISDSSDATFYIHHTGLRGEKTGIEYRWIADEEQKGAIMIDWLEDRQVDDGTVGSDRWGYSDYGDRANSERYWIRMKYDSLAPLGFKAKLDIDTVSDQDYLREFENGYTGFDYTDSYFQRVFGRGLEPYDEPTRLNRLNLKKAMDTYVINADLKWYDDSADQTESAVQKLPSIEIDTLRQKISGTSIYFDIESQYDYSFQQDLAKDHRLEIYPRVYIPFRLSNFLFIEPSAAVKANFWSFDNDETEKENTARILYDTSIDMSSRFYKIYSADFGNIDKIRHTIRPGIMHSFTPDIDQSFLPESLQVEGENLITGYVINSLTARTLNPSKKEGGYLYSQICRIKVSQSIDIDKEKDQADNSRFTPLEIRADLNPVKYLSIKGEVEKAWDDNSDISRNIGASLSDNWGNSLSAEYRYEQADGASALESFYTSISFGLNEKLTLFANYERDIIEDKSIEGSVGFLYKEQCWSFEGAYTDSGTERAYYFMVNLNGFSNFEKNISVTSVENAGLLR